MMKCLSCKDYEVIPNQSGEVDYCKHYNQMIDSLLTKMCTRLLEDDIRVIKHEVYGDNIHTIKKEDKTQ